MCAETNNGSGREGVLKLLLELQEQSADQYLDDAALQAAAAKTGLSVTKLREIRSFYAMLYDAPVCGTVIGVCSCSPCELAKAESALALLKAELGIGAGETTADGAFSIRLIPCVGACDIGPVIKVGDEVYGDLDAGKVHALIATLRDGRKENRG